MSPYGAVSVSDTSAAENAAADGAQHGSVGAGDGSDDAELQPSSEHVHRVNILPKCKCCVMLVDATEEVVVIREDGRDIDAGAVRHEGQTSPCGCRPLVARGRLIHGHHSGHPLTCSKLAASAGTPSVCSNHVVEDVGSKAHAARTEVPSAWREPLASS